MGGVAGNTAVGAVWALQEIAVAKATVHRTIKGRSRAAVRRIPRSLSELTARVYAGGAASSVRVATGVDPLLPVATVRFAASETLLLAITGGSPRRRSRHCNIGRPPGKDKSHYGQLKGCSGWPKTNPSSDKNTPHALPIDDS